MNKKVLTFNEAADYMGMSKSCLYKMTSKKILPHYKPNGKMIFFDLVEIENYLLSVRVKPQSEIEVEASIYTSKGNNRRIQNKSI
jgi:excisionase family DNA binding protein